MRSAKAFFIMATVSAAAHATAVDSVANIISRIAAHESMIPGMTPQAFENPAIRQWEHRVSYSTLSGVYRNKRLNASINPQRGEGLDYTGVEADSYIKHHNSTLWGNASYRNGKVRSVVWNESSDADLIYPYFTADSVGGDLKGETYSFSGGYADHSDRWRWGVTLGYTAGLYYRNIDPRPRNVTGKLDIAIGGAMRIGSSGYQAGASLNYRKYKQTCSLEFVNELTTGSYWHLTGLGTHYQRFTSNSSSHYYNGYRWGGSLELYPQEQRGAVLAIGYKHFSFDHILTSLNKLPLTTADEDRLDLQAGWISTAEHHVLAGSVSATILKRTGTENIFGDPSSSIYPQIGSMKMYVHNLTSINLAALWQWHPDKATMLSIKPEAGYDRSRQSYAEPKRHVMLSTITSGVYARISRGFGPTWRAGIQTSFYYSAPARCSISIPEDQSTLAELRDIELTKYDIQSRHHSTLAAGFNASRAISDKYAFGLCAKYSHTFFARQLHANSIDLSISFIF